MLETSPLPRYQKDGRLEWFSHTTSMTTMIIENSAKSYEPMASNTGATWIPWWEPNKMSVGKVFSKRYEKGSTIYTLLIASIFFTLLNAITIYSQITKKNIVFDTGLSPESGLILLLSNEYNPLGISSFIFLALTCLLALITIAKKDRSNARLLTKLQQIDRQLEIEVSKRTNEHAETIRAKDHFLGVATHDLKAPLSGILGLVELIRIENSGIPARDAEYLEHIEYSCLKMQRLIHDILEINRFEQGKVIVKREKVDLASVINGLRRNFAPGAAKKGIDLILENTDSTMETDADSLTRILENLISNAIKFSPSGTKVRLSVKPESDLLRFEVADEGPGIPLDEQARLFNRFERLSNRPTNSEISTGLGLSIVRELTTQLGGEITFESEPGRGSTFIVRLPQIQQSGNYTEIE